MASQAQILKEKIEEYKKKGFVDPRILQELDRRLDYANTVDPVVSKLADNILNNDENK